MVLVTSIIGTGSITVRFPSSEPMRPWDDLIEICKNTRKLDEMCVHNFFHVEDSKIMGYLGTR